MSGFLFACAYRKVVLTQSSALRPPSKSGSPSPSQTGTSQSVLRVPEWHFVLSRHWSDEKWKSIMARGGGGNKKRFHYCTDSSGQEILYSRTLQGHSGLNLIDPSLQDNFLIPDDFFKYIYHVGCAIILHSIINSGSMPGGQNLSKRQTVFFLLVDPFGQRTQGS